METTLALIPARGGSRGIPRKNLSTLEGKPLVAWTIDAVKGAGLAPVVSTDDLEIAAVAASYGADVPFIRPEMLALDGTPADHVALHALKWYLENGRPVPKFIAYLQPTSPLRTSASIANAIRLAESVDTGAVVSVCRARHHPYWCKRIMEGGKLTEYVQGSPMVHRRQDLPPAYALNGAIYVALTSAVMETGTLCKDRAYAYLMGDRESLDVDTPEDLELAALLLGAANASR